MQKLKIRFGKLLISFSFVLLFLGLSFSIDAPKLSSNNINDNNTYASNDPKDITITTINGEEPLPTNNTGNNSVVSPGNGDQASSNGATNNQSPSVNSSNNNDISNKENNNSQAVNTFEQTLDTLRNSIQSTYGVTIKYGNETDGYVVGGYGIESITDQNIIYNALVSLQNNMALYPTNFFKEMRSGGLPLTVYLIQRYSSANITGITEKTKNGIIISIALDYPFSDSFNHETYHYMEHYINAKGGSFSNWNNYNPSGFSYGVYDDRYVYSVNFSEDAFFVNSYAQSYEYEDRASTFEYMMAPSKISPLNTGKNIWAKAKVMCETIDYYFTTVNANTTEYWERFVG